MASLEKRNQTYRVVFMYAGKKHGYSLDTGDKATAEGLRGGVEKTLMLLGQGAITIPAGADVVAFVRNGGRVREPAAPAPETLTFGKLRDRYLAAHSNGALEASSLTTIRIHLKHLGETLGEKFPVRNLTLADVQRHVERRRGQKYRGKRIGPVTIKKEVTTLRAAWNWGVAGGLVQGSFPLKGIAYPKTDEKPPFMTRPEIERRLDGLPERERDELWDCLFLTTPEVAELLDHVKATAGLPWVYPAVAVAAHTGARRSEILRIRTGDVDLSGKTLTVREKKKQKGQRTTRRVPLSPFLVAVLTDWLAIHPGGPYLFCQSGVVSRSRKRSRTTGHRSKDRAGSLKGRQATVTARGAVGNTAITRDEAHDHFKRTLAGSKWAVLRGWHVLRHSFISNCAAAGVDQRLIDAWAGHTTEIRKRYLHLIPSSEQAAIGTVFG